MTKILHVRFLIVDFEIKCFAREVLSQPDVSSTGMPLHAFIARNARCNGSNGAVGLLGQSLISERLDELADVETTGIAGRFFGGR